MRQVYSPFPKKTHLPLVGLLTFPLLEAPDKVSNRTIGTPMDLKIPDMSCGHCTAAIQKAVMASDPSARLAFDLPSRSVNIETSLSLESVQGVLEREGYASEHLTR